MQVFEFHFNPELKPDLIFDSFCYEPENLYERRLGSLYMVGFLKNVLPQNLKFLEKIAKVIKEKYYKSTIFSPERALKESLKEANEFLEGIAKKGDVSWLGNLSFAVLSFIPHQKPWWGVNLNFTKVGEIKIFLLRGRKITDIDKKLRFQDIEPYPLKIFGNIVSGKLAENDLILVQTEEISNSFQEQNLIEEITRLTPFNIKGLKAILDEKKDILEKITGVFLAILLTKEVLGKKETISPKISKEFSFKEVFEPFLIFLKSRFFVFQRKEKKPKARSLNFKKKIKFLKFPKIQIPKIKFELNKKVVLILGLIFLLAFGFVFSKFEKNQKIKIFSNSLKKIQEKLYLAESFLILENPKAREKANSLLKETFEEISPILKETRDLPEYFSAQIFSLKDKILNNLYSLNKLEKIDNPSLFFEFKAEKFIPQKFLLFENNLYFFSPYAKNLFLLKENGENEIIETDQKTNLATEFSGSILVFTKPNQLTISTGGERFSTNLEEPYPDFNFDDFSFFRGNLYFFDKKAGQIIKYPSINSEQVPFNWGKPELWLKKAVMAKSISVDGSIWILEKDNSIERYYAGNLQEKIELGIFPYPRDFSKIFTSSYLPYLYLLEPVQKRIVILNKSGQIVKQFQSEKFDNLLDFGVSENGKTIYLLNGLKVYKIEF